MKLVRTIEEVHTLASGRWVDIFGAIGMDTSLLRAGKPMPCPCPGCPAKKDGFTFDDTNRRGDWICSGKGNQHYGDGIDLVREVFGLGFIDAVREILRVLGVIWMGKTTDTTMAASHRTLCEKKFREYANSLVDVDSGERKKTNGREWN